MTGTLLVAHEDVADGRAIHERVVRRRIAPPGMPKTTSTSAASSERTRLCAPVIGSVVDSLASSSWSVVRKVGLVVEVCRAGLGRIGVAITTTIRPNPARRPVARRVRRGSHIRPAEQQETPPEGYEGRRAI